MANDPKQGNPASSQQSSQGQQEQAKDAHQEEQNRKGQPGGDTQDNPQQRKLGKSDGQDQSKKREDVA